METHIHTRAHTHIRANTVIKMLRIRTIETSCCNAPSVFSCAKTSLEMQSHGKEQVDTLLPKTKAKRETRKQRVNRTLPFLGSFTNAAEEKIQHAILVSTEMCEDIQKTVHYSCKVCGFCCSHAGSMNAHLRDSHAPGSSLPVYGTDGRLLPLYKLKADML